MEKIKLAFLKLQSLINKKYLIVGTVIILILILRSVVLREPFDQLVFTVFQGSLVDMVEVSGIYTTAAQTKVVSPTNGIVTKLYIKNNEEVVKGDPLFHIESTASDEAKALSYSNYQSAISKLKTSKQSKETSDALMWTKHKALLDAQNKLNLMDEHLKVDHDNLATGEKYTQLEISSIKAALVESEKAFGATEKQFLEADSAITSAQAAVNSSKLTYDATKSITINAPTSGKVVNLLKKVGDEVAASTVLKIAPPVLIIANLENPSITAIVSEAYIPYLAEGQQAEIIFDVVQDQVFKGTIETIDEIGTNVAGIVTYNARVSIEEETSFMKPNMSTTLSIETFRKDNILMVPNSAIVFENDKTYVKKANNNDDLIEVELGVKGLVKTEVINGLWDGLEIIADISSS